MTKLKVQTNPGRPNWDLCFTRIRDENRGGGGSGGGGGTTVFYCGNPQLGKVLRRKAEDFGFNFRKEVF